MAGNEESRRERERVEIEHEGNLINLQNEIKELKTSLRGVEIEKETVRAGFEARSNELLALNQSLSDELMESQKRFGSRKRSIRWSGSWRERRKSGARRGR